MDVNETFATLATIIIEDHVEEIEEDPSLEQIQYHCSKPQDEESEGIDEEKGDTVVSPLQNIIFNVPTNERAAFLAMFKCPLTHIFSKRVYCQRKNKGISFSISTLLSFEFSGLASKTK